MYPKALIDYLTYFHGNRDYFECHEVLEEHWKNEGAQNSVWVGLIQIAVSLYHQRRGNKTGALRMIKSAIRILSNQKEELSRYGLHYEALMELLTKRDIEIENDEVYSDMNLPLLDLGLRKECERILQQTGLRWGSESDFNNKYIIHKHKLRDRTDVIEERLKQKKQKADRRIP
ncbi:DUF309 domain-containing protein [Fictibacillus sp. Mic-4]|uniref:DUF309 domain-containing protein n=1 Tax=Fictibacillus TaxID=1329200 RepID=UPI000426B7C1|nr:DUF309 domain-containing protein [Fictibacillus gelatini]